MGFTAELETWLDKIADGKASYSNVMQGFWDVFEKELNHANAEAMKAKKENTEVSDVICEKCGANLIVKIGKYGKYLACPNYPTCKNIKSYQTETGEEEKSEILCEKCKTFMVYRQGPYGRYLKCPECGENKAIVIDTGITCPTCQKGGLIRRRSKRGRYFYGCNRYPECHMALWDEPVNQFCSTCGSIMVKRTYKSQGEKVFCSNMECPTRPKRKVKGNKE